jgi:hypothetical protein
MNRIGAGIGVCVVAVALGMFIAIRTMEGAATEPAGLDATKPATWEAGVAAINDRLDQAAQALIALAQDASRAREERRQAIFLLGRIKSDQSVQFLIANVSLRLPVDVIMGDEDMAKMFPCQLALETDGDWNVAKTVLYALKTSRSADDVMRLTSVVERILSRPLAIVAVDNMAKGSSGVWKENLSAAKAQMVH